MSRGITVRKRTDKKRQIVFMFFFILFVCIGAVSFLAANSMVQKVESTFGPSNQELSLFMKVKLGYSLYMDGESLFETVGSVPPDSVFVINPSETAYSVATRLKDVGYISKASTFIDYLVYKGYDRLIQSGDFTIEPEMTAVDIANKFHTISGDLTTFTILAGWRVEEIAIAMEIYQFPFTGDQLILAVNKPQNLTDVPSTLEGFPSLEGFLMPGQYRVNKAMSLESFLATVLDKFDASISKKMRKHFTANGLDLFQAVTLASIVEKEAVVEEESPIIASVFYNRLAAGMKLESDPTVQYSIGFFPGSNTWWKNPLQMNDLKVNSQYNTYMNPGLPPSPISNPGFSALNAVAFPATSNYYYFRAACDNSGKHLFSATFEEHLSKGCQ